jgi:hypothetical protein
MTRLKVTTLLIAPLILLAGCSAFFGFNAFSGVDKPAVPTLSDYTGAGGLSKLANDLNSKAKTAAIASDPAMVQQLEAWLQTQFGTMSTPEEQQAAALYADLNLKTTPGADLVKQVVVAINVSPPTGTLASILASILPPGCTASEAVFTSMVNGLLNAEAAYAVLGASISPTPPGPPGLNMGDIVEKASVAYMMSTIVADVAAAVGSQPAAIHQLFLLATNDPTNTISTVYVADPFLTHRVWLDNLVGAAGITYPV